MYRLVYFCIVKQENVLRRGKHTFLFNFNHKNTDWYITVSTVLIKQENENIRKYHFNHRWKCWYWF
jgi:hypothetical protein